MPHLTRSEPVSACADEAICIGGDETGRGVTAGRESLVTESLLADPAVGALIAVARRIFGLEHVSVMLIESDTVFGRSGIDSARCWALPRSGTFADRVMVADGAVVTDDVHDDVLKSCPGVLPGRSFRSLGLPVRRSSGQVFGVLCGLADRSGALPAEADRDRLSELARTVLARLPLHPSACDPGCNSEPPDRSAVVKSALNGSTDAIAIFDADRRLMFANKAMGGLCARPGDLQDGADFDVVYRDRSALTGALRPGNRPPRSMIRDRDDAAPTSGPPSDVVELDDGRHIRTTHVEGLAWRALIHADVTREQSSERKRARLSRSYALQARVATLSNEAEDVVGALSEFVALVCRDLGHDVGLVSEIATTGEIAVSVAYSRSVRREVVEAAGKSRLSRLAAQAIRTGEVASGTCGASEEYLAALFGRERIKFGSAVPIAVPPATYVIETYGTTSFETGPAQQALLVHLRSQLARVAERDQARRSRENFVSTVSHEMRTPMTSVLGMLDLLGSGIFTALTPDAARLIVTGIAEGRRLSQSIETLLNESCKSEDRAERSDRHVENALASPLGSDVCPAPLDPRNMASAMISLVPALGCLMDEFGAQLWSFDRGLPTLVGQVGSYAGPRSDEYRSFALDVARKGRTTIVTGRSQDADDPTGCGTERGPVPLSLGGLVETPEVTGVVCLFGQSRPGIPISEAEAEALIILAQACLGARPDTRQGPPSASTNADTLDNALQAAWHGIAEGMAVFDHDGRLIVCNRTASNLLPLLANGPPSEEACSSSTEDHRLFHPCEEGDVSKLRLNSPAWLSDAMVADTGTGKNILVQRTLDGNRSVITVRDVTEETRRKADLDLHEAMVRWQFHIGSVANDAQSLREALEKYIAVVCKEMKCEFGRISRLVPGSVSELVPTGIVYADPTLADDLIQRSRSGERPDRPGELARRALRSSVAVFTSDAGELGGPEALLSTSDGRPLTLGWACAYQVEDDILVFERYGSNSVTPRLAHPYVMRHLEAQLSRVAERERVDRLKARFIDAISSDMNMPLATIRGILDSPEFDSLAAASDELCGMVAIARSDAERLGQVIEDTLMVHRLDRTSARPVLVEVDVGSLVKQCVLRFVCPQAVTMRLGPKNTNAMIDVRSFEQIMSHLLSNAAKFSSARQVINVTVESRFERVRVSVADTGPGIPKNFYGQIFKEFTQADASDTRRSAGIGLGLAVAKRLAERMDAVLDFDPTVETGATFFLEVPSAGCVTSDQGRRTEEHSNLRAAV